MTKFDALKILGISGLIEPEMVKKAYRKASFKYHPDTGGSLEMMKIVNEAYETLKGIVSETINIDKAEFSYPENLNDALNAIINLVGIKIEICGSWVWVSGDTKKYKVTLKVAKFKWASKKKQWYFRPAGFKSKGRGRYSMDEIRTKYGSEDVEPKQRKSIN